MDEPTTRTRERRWIVRPFVGFIRAYQKLLSPSLGRNCRYTPTCSHYAVDALEIHGLAKGSVMAVKRIARCQPLFEGGYDPVPGSGEGASC